MPEVFQGPVAQLDRATVSGTVCRGFESLLVRFFMSGYRITEKKFPVGNLFSVIFLVVLFPKKIV